MRLILGSKVIKVEVLDEKGKPLIAAEKGFTLPLKSSSGEDAIIMIKGRELPELERNEIVSVVTTSKSNDRIKYMGAVAVSTEVQLNIRILQNNEMQLLKERRRFFKIKVEESGGALFYVRDEKMVRFDEPVPITVRDVNVGGMFFICKDYEFIEDDLICFDIDLSNDLPLNIAARVLRVQRGADGSINGYGCEFQGMTAAQEDEIGRYILKKQSQKRAKESEHE